MLIAALAAAGLVIGPVLRGLVTWLAVPAREPRQRACPACEAWLVPAALPVPAALAALAVSAGTGRCSSCRARAGPPPLLVEVTAAVAGGLLAARVHPGLVLAATCWLAACAIALAYVDAAVQRLPDLLTVPAYLGTAALLLIAAAAGGHWGDLGRALLGGAAFAAFCLVLFLISPSGMGPGDLLTELMRRLLSAADVTKRGCFPSLRAMSGA